MREQSTPIAQHHTDNPASIEYYSTLVKNGQYISHRLFWYHGAFSNTSSWAVSKLFDKYVSDISLLRFNACGARQLIEHLPVNW